MEIQPRQDTVKADTDHFPTHLAMWEAPIAGPESEWGGQITDDEYLVPATGRAR